MKKILKWILRIAISLVLLIVIAVFVLPMVFDPNDHKGFIEDKIATQIGRQAHLNGEIKWKVFPWLALTFNDVTIDNAKGFQGDSLADIKTLAARIKIMPLFSKNIEVGKVIVDEAKFNLQIDKNGNSNWQSILDNVDSDSNTSSNSSSGSLNVEGVNFSNIHVSYHDEQTKIKANISNFNLNTSKITKSKPLKLDSSMHINMLDTGMDVDVVTKILAKNLFADAGIQLDINDFNISGKLSNASKQALKLELTKAGNIDFGKDTMLLPEIQLTLGEAKITSDIVGKNISKNMQLSGTYKLGAFNLNEFLKKITGAYFVTNNIFDDFASSASWSMLGDNLKLADLKINFSDTKVDGSANIKDIGKMSGAFKLHMNKFNIDGFLGDAETASSSDSSVSTPDIDFGHLRGSLVIDEMLASGTKLNNLEITVTTNGSKMVLSPIKADFYKGLLVTAIKIDTKVKNNKVIVEHNMHKIHAGPLLADLAGSQLLTGIGDLDMNINIDKPFSDVPLKTAHGNINYSLSDGAIYGLDVFGMMQKGLSMLYPEVQQNANAAEKKTSFALMQINAEVKQGILTTNKIKIESPFFHVGGKVKIDLINMTIDGTIEPMLLDIPEQLISDKYKKLLNLSIPVSLSGSLLEPRISIDAKKLLLATQKERIDKEKDRLKGKLLDSLFGKKKDEKTNTNNKLETKDENKAEKKVQQR